MLADVYTRSHRDYGNTFEFAAGVLMRHWLEEHEGKPGSMKRIYECATCRNLWERASNAAKHEDVKVSNQWPTVPVPYEVVVSMAGKAIKKGAVK